MNHDQTACGMLTSQPKTFSDERTQSSQRCSTSLSLRAHSLVSTFLCCVSTSWAGQRSASITMHYSLKQRAGWEKGDTFVESRRGYWLMQSRSVFYRTIIASTGRRLGSPDALKSRSTAIMLHRTSVGDNPRHLYSHLFTHIHITKRACVREASFA